MTTMWGAQDATGMPCSRRENAQRLSAGTPGVGKDTGELKLKEAKMSEGLQESVR